jgi:hypothetical protein
MLKIILVSATLAAGHSPAPHADYKLPRSHALNVYSGLYHAVREEHGRRAPGRNIRRLGIVGKDHRVRRASAREIAASTRTLRALRLPLLVAKSPALPPAGVLSAKAPAGGVLAQIASCESGGDPGAVSASGTFRGKYQFDYGTWAGVGGSGDPAAASESEQDMRAAMLYSRRGAQPWPVCGR